jgi:predicted enzyme related to lactoylglutathione lyase
VRPGREALGAWARATARRFPDARIRVKRIIEQGDACAVEFVLSFTHPSGQAISVETSEILTFAGGFITNARVFFDGAATTKQLGSAASPPEAPVVRWEINSRSPRAQQDFYRALFAWKTTIIDPGSGYGLVDTGGTPGGIGPEPHYGTRIYVEVADVPAALARAKELGASFAEGPVTLGGFRLGVFDDPEGNRIGLVQRGGAEHP